MAGVDKIMDLLIKNGAEENAMDQSGRTASQLNEIKGNQNTRICTF